MTNIKTFKDLVFKPHPYADRDSGFGSFGEASKLDFPNGYGVSVITGGTGTYASKKRPYELAVLRDNLLCYDTDITNNVVGHCNEAAITILMAKVQAL